MWPIGYSLALTLTAGALLIGALTVAGLWQLGFPGIEHKPKVPISVLFDVLKLAFGAVAGIGAAVALVMAYRRQRVAEAANRLAVAASERAERIQAHTERIAADNVHDAAQRRVTELYGQAVEQLGHAKAAVRLGGLYSLERLAQDYPQHRQTVVDVVCAYLRMPFQPPQPAPDGDQLDSPGEDRDDVPPLNDHHDSDAQQELQVRLAAQRLLTRHLATPSAQDTYWDGMVIDLTGAHLVDFDFSRCRPHQADFRNAQFTGDAEFEEANFNSGARFNGAQFNGKARFYWASLNGDQRSNTIEFNGAQFNKETWFTRTHFKGKADFDSAQFNGDAWFDRARFDQDAGFDRARFSSGAWFRGVEVNGNASFNSARFNGDVGFNATQFSSDPTFTDATASYPNDRHVWPAHWETEPPSSDTTMARLVRRQR